MKVIPLISVVIACILGIESFIIPDELPSLLSIIYSNIPTIKKGTDSRLGWGFRLGDRADFQVLVELGPQTNTQPLANQGEGSNSKRNTLNSLADTLYAQNQQAKTQRKEAKKEVVQKSEVSDWLNSWSKSVHQDQENEALPFKARPGLAIGEIDAKSVIPEDTEPIEQKYKKEKFAVPIDNIKTTTSKEDALDNVDLD